MRLQRSLLSILKSVGGLAARSTSDEPGPTRNKFATEEAINPLPELAQRTEQLTGDF
ncbi:MAG: hypothetical protein IPN29_22285 [Saprospiraceae bacterium]|nr:hypothetical protein [Saprospiraceae bacterium]